MVSDPATKACAIIDSVLDYDAASASTSTIHADKIIAYVKEQGLTVEWILETHVHADHLTAGTISQSSIGWQNCHEPENCHGTGNLWCDLSSGYQTMECPAAF